jgi:hypothetical protein
VGHDCAVRLLHGGDEGVLIERLQRARVEDLHGDPLLRSLVGRFEGLVHQPSGGDYGHVLALAMDPCLADLDRLDLVGDLALDAVQRSVLEEDDWIVLVDGAPEEAAHVLGCGREDDLEPRHVHEPRLELLGMLGARRPTGASLRADREGHLDLAARHVPVLGGLADDLLHRQGREVLVHDLDDRAHAGDRGPDARADDGHLGDRRIAHALGPELLEHPLRHAHRAAHLGDVLAHDEDVVVPPHRGRQGVANGFPVGELRHQA